MSMQMLYFQDNSNKITLVLFFYFYFSWVVGGFQKSDIIFGNGISKYLLFLTGRAGVGGWSEKGQKHPYVIQRWFRSLIK